MPSKNSFAIADYFGEGVGYVTARKKLIADGKVKAEWLRKYKTKKGKVKYDFKGLYVFLNDDSPFYVGISKGVIGRVFQHLKGHNHNTSTLAYNISLIRHELLTGERHSGTRNELNFKTNVEPAKLFLSKQRIAFHHVNDTQELYLFEVYCAMKFQTLLNKFETH